MRQWLKWSQYALWMLGFASLGFVGFQVSKAMWSQHQGSVELQRRSVELQRPSPPSRITGGLFGLLEIPRLHLSVVVFEGSDDSVLDRGAGHLMESAALAETGNVVMAGHRDTFFRPLRNIREGDIIQVKTASLERTYVVESTKIVTPSDVGVLDPTPTSVLTLITCYPFRYVGPAPDRFIVRAVETDAPSESAAAIRRH